MTEPTDDELDAVIAEYRTRIYPQDMHPRFERAIMRAAIAKWGTPPAVAGEPYGYLFTAQEATIVGDERKSMREVFTRKKPPCASVALYTTPQPTKAQAGAVPLTDEQIDAVAESMPGGLAGFLKGWGWRQFAREILTLRRMPDWEPQFDCMTPKQEELAIQFCQEIAGPRGERGSPPDPVRLLEMAEALYKAEREHHHGIKGGQHG